MSDASKQVTQRIAEFKYFPCDSVNIAINDNGFKLILGVEELDNSVTELVGLHFTHKTGLFLKAALEKALNHHEEQTGVKFEQPQL